MSRRLSCLIVLVLPVVAWAQVNVPPAALAKLKDATVFLSVDYPEETLKMQGSGCLFKKKGKTGYILTNAHVVRMEGLEKSSVDVVFRSGTDTEKTVKGQIAALDKKSDLAVIQVEMEGLPASIGNIAKGSPKETTPVCVLGFPFGEALSPTKSNPAVTVSQATVSSIRKDDSGRILAIQLDGAINPGNSGGPVVDGNGNLIGIAAAAVHGRGIGFAIPADQFEQLLAGYVREVVFTETENAKGKLKLRAEVELVDPLHAITQVGLILTPSDRTDGQLTSMRAGGDRKGDATQLKGGSSYTLKLKEGKAAGAVNLNPAGQNKAAYLVQVKYLGRDKKWNYTEPKQIEFNLLQSRSKKEKKQKEEKSAAAEDEPAEPVPEASDATTKTPGPIEDLALAGGGRFILLKLKGIPGLAMYDLYKAGITGTLRLPSSDFLFAAGGKTAVVYFPDDNVFQTWDLKSLTKKKTKPSPIAAKVNGIAMGHSRDDQAVVTFTGSGGARNGDHFLLNTASLEAVMEGGKPYCWRLGHNHDGNPFHAMRTDADLTYVVEWVSGLSMAARTGGRFSVTLARDVHGQAAIGDDGFVYCSNGMIASIDLVKVGSVEGQRLYPAVGGGLFLGLDEKTGVTVFPSGKTTPLCKWGEFPGLARVEGNAPRPYYESQSRPGDLSFDKRIIFVPALGRIVFVPVENDRLELRRFDLKATLDESGIDYLVVLSLPKTQIRSRAQWEYQMQVLSKAGDVKYKLEFAPEGMTVSDAGLITWKVPAKLGVEGEKVVVLVSDKAGEQAYHSFTLSTGAGDGGTAGSGAVYRITYRD
jgi:hypothetical protein